MTRKYLINPALFGISMATTVTLLILAVVMVILQNYLALIVFLLLSVFFVHEAIVYGKVIVITNEFVKKTFLGKTELEIHWNDVKQVGVAGTRVFMKDFTGGNGTIYIYVSREEMDEQQVFDMMIDWPPKEKIYLKYDVDRLNAIQTHFSGRIKKYKTGKTKIYNSED